MDDGMDEHATGAREPKVQRVIRQHDLEVRPEDLASRWRGDDGSRTSLRSLATELNRQVLEAAMLDAGLRPLEGEVENLYRLLTADDVAAGRRTEAEAKLERNGLDLEDLRSDFVSHQAIHTFLRDRHGVELPEPEAEDRAMDAVESIQRLVGRLRTVTDETLNRLDGEEVELGEVDVFVSVQVYCERCSRQFELEELLDRGGCDCHA